MPGTPSARVHIIPVMLFSLLQSPLRHTRHNVPRLSESGEATHVSGERRDAPGAAEAVWMRCIDGRGRGTTGRACAVGCVAQGASAVSRATRVLRASAPASIR